MTARVLPGCYPDPADGPARRYIDGPHWSDPYETIHLAQAKPNGSRQGRKFPLLVGGAVIATVVLASLAACSQSSTSPSESYSWGEKAGNSAVSLVKAGMGTTGACEDMITAGMKWADNPVLNETPPPKNFDRADAQKGCLDQLHSLGY